MTRGDDRWIRDEALRGAGQPGPGGPGYPDADPPTVPGANGRRARHAGPSAEPDASGWGAEPYSWPRAYGEPGGYPGNGHYQGGHSADPGRYGAPDPYRQPGAGDAYRQPGLGDPLSQPGARPDRDPYSQPGIGDPLGQPARPDRDPYSQPGVSDLFGQPGVRPDRDPYSQPGVRDSYRQPGVRPDWDPYSQPGIGDQLGQPARPDRDPYSQPGVSDLFGQPGVRPDRDPYSQPGVADPYSQPGVPDLYRQQSSAAAQNGRAQRSFPDALGGYGQAGDFGGPEDTQPGGGAGPGARGRSHERTQPAGSPSAGDYGPPDGLGLPAGYARSGDYGPPDGRGLPAGYARPGDYGPPGGGGLPAGYGGSGDYGDPGAGQFGAASGPFRWQPSEAGPGPQPGADLPGGPPAQGRYPAEPGQPPVRPGGRRPGGDVGAPAGDQRADTDAGRANSGQFGRGGWAEDTGTGDHQAAVDDGGFIPGFDDGGDGGRRRPQRTGRLFAPALAIVLAIALLCALVGGGFYVWGKLHSPDYSGAGTGSVTVQVMPGDTATSLAPRLVKLGVVASTNAFVSAAKKSSNPAGLEPGTFKLRKHMSGVLAYALLLNPKSRLQTIVTIPDGLRLSQILSTLGARTQWPASAYTRAIKDTAALGLPAYAHGKVEGYLYPATYTIQPGTSALDILRAMVARYNQEAASLNLVSVAGAKQLTPDQVIVVASLLEAEGGSSANYAKIARVIYNRLNIHMVLQLDSTVLYALNKFGFLLTHAQLQVKSPYNTFIHPGLPPGPIDSPGQAAIDAALHPASGNWLYFVTVSPKTGLTKFTNNSTVFQRYEAECRANGAC